MIQFTNNTPNGLDNLRQTIARLLDQITTGDGISDALPTWEMTLDKGEDGGRKFVLVVPAQKQNLTTKKATKSDAQ
jgi:hypothetical protein